MMSLRFVIGYIGYLALLILTAIIGLWESFEWVCAKLLSLISNKKYTTAEIFYLTPLCLKAANLAADWAGID